MKETFYFSHDYNSRNDPKLINLQIKHGMEGIGCYWCIVEMLYEQNGEMPLEYERIAFVLRCDRNVIQSVVNDFDLFIFQDGLLSSNSVIRRIEERNLKSIKARESVNERWKKTKENTNVQNNDTNVQKNDTIKESKVNKRNIIYSPFYDYQIEVAKKYVEKNRNTEPDKNSYQKYVSWIFNKDEFLTKDILGNPIDRKKRNILQMPSQLTFIEFTKIKNRCNGSTMEIFEDMENWKDLKKRTSVYKTALTFLKNRNK